MDNYELYLQHHGVKGMKWGVRKKDKVSNEVKKENWKKVDSAKKNRNVAKVRKNDTADAYRRASKSYWSSDQGKAIRAKEAENAKEAYKQAKKDHRDAFKTAAKADPSGAAKRAVVDGAKAASNAVAKVAMWKITDDIFFGGAQQKVIKTAGRAATTAVLMAMGHHDIKWYDKQGRRVG